MIYKTKQSLVTQCFKKTFILSVFILTSSFTFGQNAFEIQKLQDFAKLYGVVRYFHPSDEASLIDWKAFAVHGVNEISKAKTKQDFKEKLNELFLPVAPSISFTNNFYQWGSEAKYPVYWIHNGLGLDTNSSNMYSGERFNKTRANFSLKSAGLFLPFNIEKGKAIKLVYEVNTKGFSFGIIKLFDKNNKLITHAVNSKISNTGGQWETRELLINNFNNLSRLLIGLFCEEGDSSFRNLKLTVTNVNNETSTVSLPLFTDKNWFAEPKADYLIRKENQLTILGMARSEQLHKTQDKLPLNPFFTLHLSIGDVIVPTVVYANKEQTLPIVKSQLFERLQNKVASIDKNEFNTNVSLANIVVLWNAFRHFYPYFNEVNLDWDALLSFGLENAFNSSTKNEHSLTLEKFTEKFKDAHINVRNKDIDTPIDDVYATPVKFTINDGELTVKNLLHGVSGLEKGDVIKEINGIPVNRFLDSISQYISGSKQWKEVRLVERLNYGLKDSHINVKTTLGKEMMLERSVSYSRNLDFYSRAGTHDKYKEINNSIFYINLNQLSSEEIDSLIPTINNYKGLIIDLRGYPKDRFHRILSYLQVSDTAKWMCRQRFLEPEFNNIEEYCSGYGLNRHKSKTVLKTKNVLLVDKTTLSNAEFLAQYIKHYNLATVIGKPTAGANGNVNSIALLGNFRVSFTGMKVKNPDGSQFHSIGVIPDVLVIESVTDIKKDNDMFINEAIKTLTH
ncbi:S41 family peptidase [Flavobacterium rakeshii]|uniref:S41 family peptidase n=1 Tax=Flavobacterium rakeshii TaxID=1038845 RepID=UPI002E7AC384|nr:S41 family peptidase [Flavobacterium rakeshii]MEE1900078.1 S41 family peptidase [Flavobacterium rakeshii]